MLKNVSLAINRGEIHAICGENGAGKSTLIKILTGVYHIDGGAVHVDGRVADIRHPQKAQELGIALVAQELSLAPALSIFDNIWLGNRSVPLLARPPRICGRRRPARSSRWGWAISRSMRRWRASASVSASSSSLHACSRGGRGFSFSTSRPRRCRMPRSTASSWHSARSRRRESPSSTSPIAWARCSRSATRSRCCAMVSWSARAARKRSIAPASWR